MKNYYLLSIVSLLLTLYSFSSCKESKAKQSAENEVATRQLSTKYATGFEIFHFDEYTKVVLKDPWDKKKEAAYAVYYLYRNDSTTLPKDDGFKIKIPLESVVVNTFSYFELLNQLGEIDKISAVTDVFRIYNPYILSKVEKNEIVDLGDPFRPDVERTLNINTDAVIVSGFSQQDTYSERLINFGIPVVYTLEWMEDNPLARAEWIKMIAAFFDKEEQADSVFNEIESRYLEAKKIAANISEQKTVMAGDFFHETWYVPGGKSVYAQMFRDAGLDYYYKDNNDGGSIGLDIETILTRFGNTYVWLGCESNTYAELAKKDEKYMLLQSVKNRRVFSNRNRITKEGGNDYFESAIANPDIVLKDCIKAVYPELLPDHVFVYVKPLE